MFSILKKVQSILPEKISKKIKIIFLLMTIGTLLEMISIGVLLSLIITIFSDSMPFTKNFIDFLYSIFNTNNIITVKYSIIIFVLFFFILKNFFLYLMIIYKNKFVFSINEFLSEKLFEKYLNSNFSYFFKNELSTITRTIEVDAHSVTKLIFALITICTEIFVIFAIVFLLALVNLEITISIAMFGIVLSLTYFLLIHKIVKKWGSLRQFFLAERFKIIQETIFGIKEIFIFRAQDFFSKRFKYFNKTAISLVRKDNSLAYLPTYLFEVFVISLILLSIFLLLYFKFSYEEIILTLTILVTSASRIYPAFTRIVTSLQSIRFFEPALEKIHHELTNIENSNLHKSTINENEELLKNKEIDLDKMEIKNINFSYDSSNVVLENINLEFKKNLIYGISGESGSGKTTLLNIICGLLKIDDIKIFLNDIKANQKDYIKKIGYVPQHVFLFNDTIENNIALGVDKEKIDYEKIKKISKELQLENFINKKLKSDELNNENQNLGDAGIKVSGGQRQRIGVARALYFDPKIIIFDETTSSLDEENENKIIEIIKKIKKNKITIIVSHNEKIIKICDQILELKNKSIIKNN